MSEKTINARIIVKNNTAANFSNTNPILLKGEMGLEIDTRKFKFGDGVTAWNSLKYATSQLVIKNSEEEPTITDVDYDLGTFYYNPELEGTSIWVLIDKYKISGNDRARWQALMTPDDLVQHLDQYEFMATSDFAPSGVSGYVDKALKADKLSTSRNIALSGDVTGSTTFDGSGNVSIASTLKNVVTAGTGTKLTVNSKGLVTAVASLTATDIPSLTLTKITDAGTAASKNVGTAAGQVVGVGSNGKIDESVIPALAITEVFEASSQTAMLALSAAQTGDICVRSDINKSFILKQSPYSTLANWIELRTPPNAVLSVNNKTGAVTLTTTDLAEGSNLYWTTARGNANFSTNFSYSSVTDLADGDKVLLSTDTLILDGGN